MYNSLIEPLFDLIAAVLNFYYSLPLIGGSYGIAIILLTLTIMIILMPLTLKATKSTIRMTSVQPKLKAIQKKYKNDRQQLNTEVMKLYKEENINPLGGCLPMLAQLPFFLILFRLISGITRRISDLPFYQISEKSWDDLGVSHPSGKLFSPEHLNPSTRLYQDLSSDTSMSFGPFDLGSPAWDILQTNFLRAVPYVLLIIFVVATSYYQQRQVQSRRGSTISSISSQQQMIMRVLPLMSGFWGFIFPAGLVLYMATSNTFRVAQQAYITRSFYNKEDSQDVDVEIDLEDEEDTDTEEVEVNRKKSDREKAWEEKRKQKSAKSKNVSSKKSKNSSRVTPKGTQPSKKKRGN